MPGTGTSRLAGKPEQWRRERTVAFLKELEEPSGGGFEVRRAFPGVEVPESWDWLPESLAGSPTGLVLIDRSGEELALAPPFPIPVGAPGGHDLLAALRHELTRPRLIGVLLLRLGHYAVGVTDGAEFAARKSGARYVHGRHRAGGQSQRRWERNREQWIEKLFDEVCETWESTCSAWAMRLEGLAIGGDRIVLGRFFKHCPAVGELQERMPIRRVPVERPGSDALDDAVEAAWSSAVVRRSAGPRTVT